MKIVGNEKEGQKEVHTKSIILENFDNKSNHVMYILGINKRTQMRKIALEIYQKLVEILEHSKKYVPINDIDTAFELVKKELKETFVVDKYDLKPDEKEKHKL